MFLRIPFLARDDIRGGLLFTEGAWTDHLRRVPSSGEAVDTFLTTVEGLLVGGVSCVIEYVVRRDRPNDLERMRVVQQEMMTESSLPVLDVDTTAGYQPNLDRIVAFVTAPIDRR